MSPSLILHPHLDLTLRERLTAQFHFRPRVCTVRVLMVTDGATFDLGLGWSLGRVVQALTTDLPPHVRVEVTTARHASSPGGGTFDVPDLRFTTHDLSGYDQVWLVAVNPSPAYDPGELTALYDFMQSGGGVFATGDHEDLGRGLAGGVPRVRSMRRWHYPNPGPNGEPVAPMSGNGGHETTVGTDFDGVPQTITPTMYALWDGIVSIRRRTAPHPVLCGRAGPVRVLPDHMHEGTVEVPDVDLTLPVDGATVQEYPTAAGVRVRPQVIATATNHNPGGGQFGVIGAYDGHLVDEVAGGVGRIVVDATWHHLFGMNVEQFASAHDAVVAGSTDPALIERAAHWTAMRDYFQNTAIWLARAGTQRCIRNGGRWWIAGHVDVVMAIKTFELSRLQRLENYIEIGEKARDAFGRVAPQCQRLTWSLPLLDRLPLYDRIWPWPPELREKVPLGFAGLIDPELVESVAIGGALLALHERTEGNLDRIKETDDVEEITRDGAQLAMKVLGEALREGAEEFAELVSGRRG